MARVAAVGDLAYTEAVGRALGARGGRARLQRRLRAGARRAHQRRPTRSSAIAPSAPSARAAARAGAGVLARPRVGGRARLRQALPRPRRHRHRLAPRAAARRRRRARGCARSSWRRSPPPPRARRAHVHDGARGLSRHRRASRRRCRKRWLVDIARGELGFGGVIVSDDLDMKAVHERWPTRESRAPLAGGRLRLLPRLPRSRRCSASPKRRSTSPRTIRRWRRA